jgi:hypothetical protein
MVPVAVAAIGAAYVLGNAVGEKNLEVYKTAHELDFKTLAKSATDAAASLDKASKDFSDLLTQNASYNTLKAADDRNRKTIADLQKKINDDNEAIKRLTEQVSATESRLAAAIPRGVDFQFAPNESKTPFAYLIIAVLDIYDNYASVNSNGSRSIRNLGDSWHEYADDYTCTLTLTKTTKNTLATIKVTCDRKPDNP